MNSFWRWRVIASLLVAGALSTVSVAQSLPEAAVLPAEIERRQEQELDVQRARSAERPDVMSSDAEPGRAKLDLPTETPCFVMRELAWEGAAPPAVLADAASAVIGHCVGGQGLRVLQDHLIERLISEIGRAHV